MTFLVLKFEVYICFIWVPSSGKDLQASQKSIKELKLTRSPHPDNEMPDPSFMIASLHLLSSSCLLTHCYIAGKTLLYKPLALVGQGDGFGTELSSPWLQHQIKDLFLGSTHRFSHWVSVQRAARPRLNPWCVGNIYIYEYICIYMRICMCIYMNIYMYICGWWNYFTECLSELQPKKGWTLVAAYTMKTISTGRNLS